MAEIFFPFMSVSGDRRYSADDWARYFALFIGNGVFYSSADRLKVTPSEGMKLKVSKGAGFIDGRMYMLDADTIITLDTADGALHRIDRIVLRCSYQDRSIHLAVKKGAYSANPQAPELERNADVYELALADVRVAAGVVIITAAAITDLRLDAALCGIVTGLVEQADTTEIFNQFTAYMAEFKNVTTADMDAWTEAQKQAYVEWYTEQQQAFTAWYNTHTTAWQQDFITWFDDIQGMLSGDVAANLSARVIALEGRALALENDKAQKVLLDEDAQAQGEPNPQGFTLCIKSGALCVKRVV